MHIMLHLLYLIRGIKSEPKKEKKSSTGSKKNSESGDTDSGALLSPTGTDELITPTGLPPDCDEMKCWFNSSSLKDDIKPEPRDISPPIESMSTHLDLTDLREDDVSCNQNAIKQEPLLSNSPNHLYSSQMAQFYQHPAVMNTDISKFFAAAEYLDPSQKSFPTYSNNFYESNPFSSSFSPETFSPPTVSQNTSHYPRSFSLSSASSLSPVNAHPGYAYNNF